MSCDGRVVFSVGEYGCWQGSNVEIRYGVVWCTVRGIHLWAGNGC
jgi:hypothetical protein